MPEKLSIAAPSKPIADVFFFLLFLSSLRTLLLFPPQDTAVGSLREMVLLGECAVLYCAQRPASDIPAQACRVSPKQRGRCRKVFAAGERAGGKRNKKKKGKIPGAKCREERPESSLARRPRFPRTDRPRVQPAIPVAEFGPVAPDGGPRHAAVGFALRFGRTVQPNAAPTRFYFPFLFVSSLILPFEGRGTGHSARPNFPESAVLYPQRWSGERPSASQGRPSRSFVSPRCHGVVGGRRSREDRPPARGGGGCPAGRRHGGVCVCSSRKFFTRKSQQRERLLRRCLGDT